MKILVTPGHKRLEQELQSELDLPRGGGRTRNPGDRVAIAVVGAVALENHRIRKPEIGVIQNIKRFRPELQRHALPDGDPLETFVIAAHFCFSAPCFNFAKAATTSDLNFSSTGFERFPGFFRRSASMRLRAALSFPWRTYTWRSINSALQSPYRAKLHA